eukprot:scaffold9455_cov130-Isochrysis_galbana.AAC.3
MSISSYASDSSAASHPHSYEFSLSDPSHQSGMVQPVIQKMFATVHAAGSSLLGLFGSCMYNRRFDTHSHLSTVDTEVANLQQGVFTGARQNCDIVTDTHYMCSVMLWDLQSTTVLLGEHFPPPRSDTFAAQQ